MVTETETKHYTLPNPELRDKGGDPLEVGKQVYRDTLFGAPSGQGVRYCRVTNVDVENQQLDTVAKDGTNSSFSGRKAQDHAASLAKATEDELRIRSYDLRRELNFISPPRE